MLRLQRVSTLIGGAISVLYPPIAVVYYFARTVYKHVSLNSALPWLILVCPLLLPAFLYFPGTKALNLLGQAILLIGYGYAFTSLPKKQLRQTFVLGMVIGLICLLGLGFITQRINMSNWYSYSYQKPWIQKFTEGVFNLERLEGKALRSSFGQRWILQIQ